MSMSSITVSPAKVKEYEQRRNKLLVPDPWTDPFCAKTGLSHMYIESMLAQLMLLRAESEPGVKLNCPNSKYNEFHVLLHNVFSSCKAAKKQEPDQIDTPTEAFDKLSAYVEGIIERTLKLVKWTDYFPDIRLLDSIDDAMSWLFQHMNIEKTSFA
jgi:hypothetical protein